MMKAEINNINEMIEKWEKKHSSLLDEFNRTRGMMTEREIVECVDHRKNVLRFIEDLRQVKNCSIPTVVGQSEQLVCECGRDKINKLSGICEICWNEKFPDEAN